jgi:hypothetical protein
MYETLKMRKYGQRENYSAWTDPFWDGWSVRLLPPSHKTARRASAICFMRSEMPGRIADHRPVRYSCKRYEFPTGLERSA